ncbi:MAG: GvpL/GvpF family gas vesicle protein [Candidatus Aenigmarchaeota archaeon]|nr:GvpL/GvpF family gas vesicle protein [Candidatus Aenigmarchaeota archaeon]
MNDVKCEESVGEGVYLYCVTNCGAETGFGNIGIGNNRVYAILYKDIGVIVHKCLAKPYKSNKEEEVKSWLFSHLYTIDAAAKKFGAVVPFAFDTIIKGTEDDVRKWLSAEYHKLKNSLERLDGKAEYDIQIFMDTGSTSQEIESTNEEIQRLKMDIETKPKGIAYVLQKKLELIVINETRRKVEEYYKEYSKKICDQVKDSAEEMKAEKTINIEDGKWKDKEMILNLSCLVHNSKIEALGKFLEETNKIHGLSVRFSGPWPPFHFVG